MRSDARFPPPCGEGRLGRSPSGVGGRGRRLRWRRTKHCTSASCPAAQRPHPAPPTPTPPRKGSGLLQMSKEAEEVLLLPFRLSHFAGGGSFVRVGVEDVEGEASDDGKVFGA